MEVCVISDTHDHLDNLRKVLKILDERKISVMLHGGDFVSPFTWRVLKNFQGDIYGVFGNNDGERVLLKKLYGDRIQEQIRKIEIGGKNIALMHEPRLLEELAQSGAFDLIVYGHMHEVDIKKINNTLIINPGEACGWLYGKATFMIVNLETMDVEVLEL